MALLPHLWDGFPLYGLQARGLRRPEPLPASMGEMARDYADQIRLAQPVGPYHLLGMSLGGTIAFAIAEELQRRGESIGLLVILDGSLDNLDQIKVDPWMVCNLILAQFGYVPAVVQADADPQARLLQAVRRHPGLGLDDWPDQRLRALQRVIINNLEVARVYQPGRVRAPMLFFSASRQEPTLTEKLESWASFIDGPIEAVELRLRPPADAAARADDQARASDLGPDGEQAAMTRVLFITGFNRSGTTLLTSAVTSATQARTLTVGDLARHMPSVRRFLATAAKHGTVIDRGVDRLPVSESTPEEYCWLLKEVTGEFVFDAKAAQAGVLDSLVDELAGEQGTALPVRSRTVVLKNPWDTGRERLLLDHFASACVIVIRRDLSAIEDSQNRAMNRMATSSRYPRALIGDPHGRAEMLGALLNPVARKRLVGDFRQRVRRTAIRLGRSASKLPLDRVAFLSYDELRADPIAGASWAAHLLDPGALAAEIAAQTFGDYNQTSTSSWTARAIDWYWARAWRRARARQVKAGILAAPKRPTG